MTYVTMLIASLLIAFTLGQRAERPPALGIFSASGQVISKGKSLEGVEIVFERVSPKGLLPNSVRTDANGQWRQTGFQQGTTYRAIPKKQGFAFDPVSREFSAGTKGSLSFEGRPGAGTQTSPSQKGPTTTNPEERPPSAGTLTAALAASGKVATADGRGVPGVKIIFTLVSGTGNTPGEVETDVQGKWRQVGFSQDVVYRIRPQRLPGDTFSSAIDTLRFPPGVINVSDQNFQITIPKYVASGRVRTSTRGTGLANVTITFSLESGTGPVPAPVTTNALGEWLQQGFEIGARYKATPSKGDFQFTPGSRDISQVGAGGAQPGDLLRNLDFSVPDLFTVTGVITASEARDDGAEVTLEIRTVGGQSELICHKTRNGIPWSKQLQTGPTYLIEPHKSHSFDGKIYVFTPNSTRVDGPKSNVNFSGRGDPNIVQQTRLGQSCPP